jgi:orotidine-5'-phosphate decarboxylase
MTFRERLRLACAARDSHLCVGLDPVREQLPTGFEPDPDDVLRFVTAIIEATAEFAAAYKPNSAFYEALGPAGMEVLQAAIAAVPGDTPVILDAKRGDIDHTAERYAHAAFDVLGAGAVTVNAYLGRDSLEPFIAYKDRGVLVVCRTSNPGAGDVQDLEINGEPLYLTLARDCREWDEHGNLGLVTGATYPGDIARIRVECPEMPLLVPGVGAQGGDAEAAAAAAAGEGGDGLFVVSSSRSVMGASPGADFQHAAADAARALRDRINQGLGQGHP